MSRIRANQITNQSADGAPTVQNGLVISGVTTSTTFSGSGASLTNLPSAQLTGALPALDGSNLTGLSGVSVANQADNRLITATGTTAALNGEANLTWDATTLKVQAATPAIEISGTNSNGGNSSLHFNANANHWVLEADNYTQQNNFSIKSGTTASSTPRLSINSSGGVGIGTNNFSSQLNNEVGLAVHGSSNDNCRISITTPTKSNSRIGYYGLSNRFGMDVHNGFEIRDAEASYATRFKIDNNGYMTNNQPYGHLRFNIENDTGSFVTQTNVNTADVQNGMAHNGSGRLTVPVAGKYMIMLGCNLLDGSDMQFRMMKNGADIPGVYFQNSDGDNAWKSGSRTIVLPLSANDYIESKIIGKQDSHVWNHLTVYMLG